MLRRPDFRSRLSWARRVRIWFARWRASIRWTRERSGAATVGLAGGLVAGGMGGGSSSVLWFDKALGTNSPRPQVEVKPHAGKLTVTGGFAGLFSPLCANAARPPARVWRLQGKLCPRRRPRPRFVSPRAGRGTILYQRL